MVPITSGWPAWPISTTVRPAIGRSPTLPQIVSAINVHGPIAVGVSGEDAGLITATHAYLEHERETLTAVTAARQRAVREFGLDTFTGLTEASYDAALQGG